MRKRYKGPLLEEGGTSINRGAAPGVTWLYDQGLLDHYETILDYGSGKYDRNARYLRSKGFQVYSYDPYHGGTKYDGWITGASNVVPRQKFDIGITNYVLCVVPEYEEREIVKKMQGICDQSYHIVRDDTFLMVKTALETGSEPITEFFLEEFGGTLSKAQDVNTITAFCEYGTKTKRGFQRLCTCDDFGLEVVYQARNVYKIYKD